MFKFLKDQLICPSCHGDLIWDVSCENTTRIIEADIKCPSCGRKYSVKEGIADFLIGDDDKNDTWQAGDDYITKLFKDNPALKRRLMTASDNEMSAADMYVKAEILKREGNEKEAEDLKSHALKLAYTRESREAGDNEFKYLIGILKNENKYVVDLASGYGTWVKEILKNTDLPVIVTDISMTILKKDYDFFIKEGYAKRIAFIAFDIRKTPFKDNSVPLMTTFAGLQNVDKPGHLLSGLRRISSGSFYSICSFCSEDDELNRAELRKSGTEYMWIKENHMKEFTNSGWHVEVLNSIFTKDSPTPMGRILTDFGIDGFPVADGIFEHCIVKAFI